MIRLNSHGLAKSHRLVLRALLAIGVTAINVAPSPAQASGTWTTTGSLSTARMNHTGTLLSNGQVLVAGGVAGSYLTSSELYQPSSGKWSVTGSMNTARERHTATLLQNGQVLVAGGNNTSNFGQTSAELYEPVVKRSAYTCAKPPSTNNSAPVT